MRGSQDKNHWNCKRFIHHITFQPSFCFVFLLQGSESVGSAFTPRVSVDNYLSFEQLLSSSSVDASVKGNNWKLKIGYMCSMFLYTSYLTFRWISWGRKGKEWGQFKGGTSPISKSSHSFDFASPWIRIKLRETYTTERRPKRGNTKGGTRQRQERAFKGKYGVPEKCFVEGTLSLFRTWSA